MSFISPSRRAPGTSPVAPATESGPDTGLGARPGPGAGTAGFARPEPAAKAPPAETAEASSQGTLIVGEGIHVKGEIQSCTTLVVEGRVEASLEAAELAVRDGGVYDGKAVVESARIGGVFTGDLTVRGLLTVTAGGRVSGSLRYGELRIEQGGRLSGDVDLLAEEETSGKEAPPQPDAREAAKAAVSKAQAEGRAKAETDSDLEQRKREMIAR
ncbi:polymer-forming cytoskeletal protein [Pelagibius sp. 7325]|uniref:bactofilin family protein n=1 Tax=Pelagibius sp. 7325 TaxID=3131994 RepID=UPI0030EED94A